jgi:hypothetical protein
MDCSPPDVMNERALELFKLTITMACPLFAKARGKRGRADAIEPITTHWLETYGDMPMPSLESKEAKLKRMKHNRRLRAWRKAAPDLVDFVQNTPASERGGLLQSIKHLREGSTEALVAQMKASQDEEEHDVSLY